MVEDYVSNEIKLEIAKDNEVSIKQIDAVLKLIEEGGTVPFIARYRKEATGGLDEKQIRSIYNAWKYGVELAALKEETIKKIEKVGELTEELRAEIMAAKIKQTVDDLYEPFKQKKETRAGRAKQKGLEPLANYLLSFPMGKPDDVLKEAAKYITKEVTKELEEKKLVVKDEMEALQGAKDIIAEKVADDPKYKDRMRDFFREENIETKITQDGAEKDPLSKYEMYYNYEEPIREIKNHRILAINRGEAEGVLKVSILDNQERAIRFLNRRVVGDNENSITAPYVFEAIEDGYLRLMRSTTETFVRNELKERAEDQAIFVFAENLKRYLLTPPMKGKNVLGIDPAYRTGCKLAAVSSTGQLLDIGKIFPNPKTEKQEVTVEDRQYIQSKQTLVEFLDKYNIEIIAIGNGTASRETESFVASVLKDIKDDPKFKNRNIEYIIVNEAGASIYSASKLAIEEFPNLAVEERSAASIARRLQDPLSELIKIDPKSIGVGQYQYDVSQKKLEEQLDVVVEDVVNDVGVNINSASVPLLTRVSGLNKRAASNIVDYRNEHGEFMDREEIKNVKGIGEKTYEQCIGFLRIPEGNEKLDMTSIHPESYKATELILKKLGKTKEDIGSLELRDQIENLHREGFYKNQGLEEIGIYTYNDILDSLAEPLRDPRDQFDKPLLRSDVLKLEDLLRGMKLEGTVRNVTNFGAFIDCGVKEDGLVHVSKMSKGFIKHPLDVLSVGDIVTVWVVSVDLKKARIELSMIPLDELK